MTLFWSILDRYVKKSVTHQNLTSRVVTWFCLRTVLSVLFTFSFLNTFPDVPLFLPQIANRETILSAKVPFKENFPPCFTYHEVMGVLLHDATGRAFTVYVK